MMTINLICVGNIKEKFFVEAVREYQKRLNSFCKLNIIEVKETNFNNPTNSEIEIIKQNEAKEIKKYLTKYNILFNIQGEKFSSEEFSKFISKKQLEGLSELTFIIGGSYGVSNEIKNLVQFNLSFSNLTFPHQLFRVMCLEQIYRAFTIINNKTYHK